jgi:hypothetical protein
MNKVGILLNRGYIMDLEFKIVCSDCGSETHIYTNKDNEVCFDGVVSIKWNYDGYDIKCNNCGKEIGMY